MPAPVFANSLLTTLAWPDCLLLLLNFLSEQSLVLWLETRCILHHFSLHSLALALPLCLLPWEWFSSILLPVATSSVDLIVHSACTAACTAEDVSGSWSHSVCLMVVNDSGSALLLICACADLISAIHLVGSSPSITGDVHICCKRCTCLAPTAAEYWDSSPSQRARLSAASTDHMLAGRDAWTSGESDLIRAKACLDLLYFSLSSLEDMLSRVTGVPISRSLSMKDVLIDSSPSV